MELNNVVRAADPEAAPVLGPSRRKRSGTFHQASHRIRTWTKCRGRALGSSSQWWDG